MIRAQYCVVGQMTEAMFQEGGVYTKCGVLLEDLTPEGRGQTNLFAVRNPRAPALLTSMDGLNARFGRNSTIIAAQGRDATVSDTKRSQKSPAWTTRISEIPIARQAPTCARMCRRRRLHGE